MNWRESELCWGKSRRADRSGLCLLSLLLLPFPLSPISLFVSLGCLDVLLRELELCNRTLPRERDAQHLFCFDGNFKFKSNALPMAYYVILNIVSFGSFSIFNGFWCAFQNATMEFYEVLDLVLSIFYNLRIFNNVQFLIVEFIVLLKNYFYVSRRFILCIVLSIIFHK